MIITNYNDLAKTPLRRDALSIAEAGFESIDIEHLLVRSLNFEDGMLFIGGYKYDLNKFKDIYVVGAGKGSALAARAIETVLGPARIRAGVVIDIARHRLRKVKTHKGSYPLPSDDNVRYTDEAVRILERAGKDGLIISIFAGGASSLLCRPADGIAVADLRYIPKALSRAGASAREISTIRKHVSGIHGGHLARLAYPATVLSLVVSDIPGDDLALVAGGPTVLDATNAADAARLAAKYGLPRLPITETPKDAKYFVRVTNTLIASGGQAVEAMAARAKALGYEPVVYSRKLTGLAKDAGATMARKVKPGQALVACGATESIVTRPGKSGPNQDLALSALPYLPQDAVVVSAASAGGDGASSAAGAIVDGDHTRRSARLLRIDPEKAVAQNRSHQALRRLRDHLRTERVTADVADFVLVLRARE